MFWKKDKDKKVNEKKLNELKWETARELGLDTALQDPKAMSAKDAGKIGGHMSRKLFNENSRDMAEEGRQTLS